MESRGLAPSCGPIGETEERVELAESPLVNILFQVFLLFKDAKASKREKAKERATARPVNGVGFGFGSDDKA